MNTPPHTIDKVRRPTLRPPLPEAHADVALATAGDICALGRFSISYWHDKVRSGDAPQPAIREPRYTRWALADIRAWLAERVANPRVAAADAVLARARSASAKAREPTAAAKGKTTHRLPNFEEKGQGRPVTAVDGEQS